MAVKMRLNMKNRLQTDRPRPRHGHKYDKYKLFNIRSNIRSSIHEKVNQHWGRVEKKRCL